MEISALEQHETSNILRRNSKEIRPYYLILFNNSHVSSRWYVCYGILCVLWHFGYCSKQAYTGITCVSGNTHLLVPSLNTPNNDWKVIL